MPPPLRSLSAKLLLLTVAFVMMAEVLIFAPSVARFRETYLTQRLASAHLAILALEGAPDQMVGADLEAELLKHVGAYLVALEDPKVGRRLLLSIDMPPAIDEVVDLGRMGFFDKLGAAFVTLLGPGDRILRVLGTSPEDGVSKVEIVLNEAPLRREMINFGYRVLALSLAISLFTAALIYLSLHLLLVRPLRRMTENMMAFREDPENAERFMPLSGRSDEVGLAEAQLREMQEALWASLHQKARLAAVGVAVTKISHDLRNILSTASLMSDRLAASQDPDVKRSAGTLMTTLDRAINLCRQTLNFTREGPAVLELSRVDLHALIDEVGSELPASLAGEAEWRNEVPAGVGVEADRAQLYRVFHNLGLNALQAGATAIVLDAARLDERLEIELTDNGPGLSPRARERLFQPFTASGRSGGTGLGLAIARELARAHGGDLELRRSDAAGTCFRLTLPLSQASRQAAQ
ncbi:Signal transduction histidine kinase [Tistlia consotensis]|uniref:histidine kinase n=2 Tax=Tistlia TaxID=1321364 RepID=A0A1Y6B4V7_9PROT|nr:Signal transduction histidine kinase [Tistlia consotensis USBA 355]SNR27890.1 Signal transduction histidine kinase [Tistlia consotensis]